MMLRACQNKVVKGWCWERAWNKVVKGWCWEHAQNKVVKGWCWERARNKVVKGWCPEHAQNKLVKMMSRACSEQTGERLMSRACSEQTGERLMSRACSEQTDERLMSRACSEQTGERLMSRRCSEQTGERLMSRACREQTHSPPAMTTVAFVMQWKQTAECPQPYWWKADVMSMLRTNSFTTCYENCWVCRTAEAKTIECPQPLLAKGWWQKCAQNKDIHLLCGGISSSSVVYPDKGIFVMGWCECWRGSHTRLECPSQNCRMSTDPTGERLMSRVCLAEPHLLLSCILTKGSLCRGGASTEEAPIHGSSAPGKTTRPSCPMKVGPV